MEQVLSLTCTRTKDESPEKAGNPLIPKCPDFRTLRLATPRLKRKLPIKEPESRGLYIAMDLVIFETGVERTGVERALHANFRA